MLSSNLRQCFSWREALAEAKQFLAPVFKRVEQRVSAGAFIDGLLSPSARQVGCWQKKPGMTDLSAAVASGPFVLVGGRFVIGFAAT
ncbi:MAG: hypothetical protein AAAC48_18760 [Phyllobacterium sp.]|uniref:hypothetical protein n=1 Tax=Phyllobacterium sp. TaxID=1871046 RepID=UPI0030F0391D